MKFFNSGRSGSGIKEGKQPVGTVFGDKNHPINDFVRKYKRGDEAPPLGAKQLLVAEMSECPVPQGKTFEQITRDTIVEIRNMKPHEQ